jgi:hypothetical protein
LRNSGTLTTTSNTATVFDDTAATAGSAYTYQVTVLRNGTPIGSTSIINLTMPTLYIPSSVNSEALLKTALQTAGTGQEILITQSFTLTALTAPLSVQPKQGVLLVGACGASGPTITITSPNSAPLNLSLSGVTIYGIAFVGRGDATHPEVKLLTPGAGNAPNRTVCTAVRYSP